MKPGVIVDQRKKRGINFSWLSKCKVIEFGLIREGGDMGIEKIESSVNER